MSWKSRAYGTHAPTQGRPPLSVSLSSPIVETSITRYQLSSCLLSHHMKNTERAEKNKKRTQAEAWKARPSSHTLL